MEHGPLGIGLLQRWCGFGTALTGDPVGHPRRKATTSNSIPRGCGKHHGHGSKLGTSTYEKDLQN
jgi:hypothetical protein